MQSPEGHEPWILYIRANAWWAVDCERCVLNHLQEDNYTYAEIAGPRNPFLSRVRQCIQPKILQTADRWELQLESQNFCTSILSMSKCRIVVLIWSTELCFLMSRSGLLARNQAGTILHFKLTNMHLKYTKHHSIHLLTSELAEVGLAEKKTEECMQSKQQDYKNHCLIVVVEWSVSIRSQLLNTTQLASQSMNSFVPYLLTDVPWRTRPW